MKKLVLVAVAAVVVFGSCKKSGPSASLKSEVDTISYELGMLNSNGLKQYLADRVGIDTTSLDDFYKGLMEAANAGDNKKKAAYFAGIQIGQQIATQMYAGINHQLFGEDSVHTISMRNFLSGFIAASNGKAVFNMDSVQKEIQGHMERFRAANLANTYAENKAACEKYIADKEALADVKKLPNGTLYRVIKEGQGKIPADSSVVEVNYVGKTIDGKEFDSSVKNNDGKPIEIHVNGMIPGWIDALTHLPEGSKWELYIPQDQAYGDREAGEIKPFSALVFELELVKVK